MFVKNTNNSCSGIQENLKKEENQSISDWNRSIIELIQDMTLLPKNENFQTLIDFSLENDCKDGPATNTDISTASFVSTFLAENRQDELRQYLVHNLFTSCRFTVTTENTIAVPNISALQAQAQYYYEKYNITILISSSDNLGKLITDLHAKINQPTYIGIITGHILCEPTSHVTALLFYFSGDKSEKPACVIMDSLGKYVIKEELTCQADLPVENIYFSTFAFQADTFSCRTGALILLRNCLLSIKHHGYTGGFQEALKKGILDGNKILSFPPDWDYTNQISNKKTQAMYGIVTRDFFSKQALKRNNPKTIQAFREKYQEDVVFSYEVWNCKNKQTVFQKFPNYPASPHKSSETLSPGKLFFFFNGKNYASAAFMVTKKVHAYLRQKGILMHEQLMN